MWPLLQRCTLPAHEEATLPLSFLLLPWMSPLQLLSPSMSQLPTPLPFLLSSPIAVAVAVVHCCCGCHQPSSPPSLLHCHQPLPLLLPLPLVNAIPITVGHCSFHLHRPSLSPSPLAISESCCLGAVRIVFKQFKQRMLTLFHFVWTVGGALIKAGRLTRCQVWRWPTPALGGERQAVSG